MGGVPKIVPAKIVVVGTHAARMAVGLGGEVVVLDRFLVRLRQVDELFRGRVKMRFSTSQAIEDEIPNADAFIGAVLVHRPRAPKLVSKQLLCQMTTGSVLVDVDIDQRCCFETFYAITQADPTYEIDGLIHCCIANMPGAMPLTPSYALNNAMLPFGLLLANSGLQAIRADQHLAAGLNVHSDQITNQAIARSLNLPFVEPEFALAN